ncbi:hypothetical protein DFH29DRAFT_882317 [Suillus ampliporus]|nr:hypothetical protein DFH29DRAFT_882317 [Suillus ampliporus]
MSSESTIENVLACSNTIHITVNNINASSPGTFAVDFIPTCPGPYAQRLQGQYHHQEPSPEVPDTVLRLLLVTFFKMPWHFLVHDRCFRVADISVLSYVHSLPVAVGLGL